MRVGEEFRVGLRGVEIFAANAIEEEIDDGGSEERENLRDDEAADDGDAERAAKLAAGATAEGEWDTAEQRGHGGHHDGTEAQQTGLVDRLFGLHALIPFGFESEVDHHDGILLDDTDEQNDADERDDGEIDVEKEQGEDGANTGGGQRRENGDGVNVAFVENTENDVDDDKRGENENGLVLQRGLKGFGCALEAGADASGQVQLLASLVDGGRRRPRWTCRAPD